jgi:hypothetical protein
MARFKTESYKGYPIYATAALISGSQNRWKPKGLIFLGGLSDKIELHWPESLPGLMFDSEEAAKQHGLDLCKTWIDKRLCTKTNLVTERFSSCSADIAPAIPQDLHKNAW